MHPPKHLGSYPGRDVDLQENLEEGFTALIIAAENAGWLPFEAYQAVISLAEAHACADISNEAMADFLEKMNRQR
ncbi:hypothetical protein [Paracoccus sulfuroxidans]|uniref:Uncharacterized protein n=1 Tax=Paracoccus sulfuroxidans TaxID=384678 RepID=A0A562NRV5_9RHOB|nr:hypothetical protein [Paracoccus sulfuroxidans]TWI34929.1 hypothetical protein IQ24_01437 [Paracoccus sulfuroxidans]